MTSDWSTATRKRREESGPPGSHGRRRPTIRNSSRLLPRNRTMGAFGYGRWITKCRFGPPTKLRLEEIGAPGGIGPKRPAAPGLNILLAVSRAAVAGHNSG